MNTTSRVSPTTPAPRPVPGTPDSGDDRRQQRSRRTAELFSAASHEPDPACRAELHHEIVVLNLSIAETVARRFGGRDVDEEDLRQVACEALVKAVRRFDVRMEKDFLSFAVPTIRGELQRYFRDLGWAVRPTRSVQEAQWRIRKAQDRLTQELGRTPGREEVAAASDLTPEEHDTALAATGCFRPTSLDQPAAADHGGRASVGDLLADETQGLDPSEARLMLAPVVRRLSSRDQRILYLRFCEDRAQHEIGQEIGVTQTQVSRILGQILDSLRSQLIGQDD